MTDGGGNSGRRPRARLTPTPNRARSSLSRADIDEILDSPIETDYTYSHSVAYRRSGSTDYTYPRLSRPLLNASGWGRIASSKLNYDDLEWEQSYFQHDKDRTYPYPTDQYYYRPKFEAQKNYFVRAIDWVTWLLRSILVFIVTTAVYVAYRVTSFLKSLFGYFIWAVTYPIMSPVYAAKKTFTNAGYFVTLIKDAAYIVYSFIASIIWQTEYISVSLWSDIKSLFWRLLGYKVPISRPYVEKLATPGRKIGTRYTMRAEETEYDIDPMEVEYVEKPALFSRLWYYIQWIFNTALWILTFGYVKLAPSYAALYPLTQQRTLRKTSSTTSSRSTYMKFYNFFNALFDWLVWIVTGGPIVKIYRYFYPEIQRAPQRTGLRSSSRLAHGPVAVPRTTAVRNKTEQILVNTWNSISDGTHKAMTIFGDTPEKRKRNAAWLWWLPLLLLLLLSTYYVGKNTYADYKNETETGTVHNPAEYIASKFPSDVHLIPEGVKNTFSGIEHQWGDLKTGTSNVLYSTKNWLADKTSYIYYSALHYFYNSLATFFGVLEYIWSGITYVFYSIVDGLHWVLDKITRPIYYVTESLFEGSSKFLDKIGHGIKQTANFLIQLPIRLFSYIGHGAKVLWEYIWYLAIATGKLASSAGSTTWDVLTNGVHKIYDTIWNIGSGAQHFLRHIGSYTWNFFAYIGNSIYFGLHYIGSKIYQASNYILFNLWNGIKIAGKAIANAHYYVYQLLRNAVVYVYEGIKFGVFGVWETLKNIVFYIYEIFASVFSILWMLIRYLGLMLANFLRSFTFGGWHAIENAGSKIYEFCTKSTFTIYNFIKNSTYNIFGFLKNGTWKIFESFQNIGSVVANFLRSTTFGGWHAIEYAGAKTYGFFKNSTFSIYNFLKYATWSIVESAQNVGSTFSNLISNLWHKFLDIFSLDWLESPVNYILSKGRNLLWWLIKLPNNFLGFVYQYIVGPVSGWFAYVYRGINQTTVPYPHEPKIAVPKPREPEVVELQYRETETYSDNHPIMIKLRQIVDDALKREKIDLEHKIEAAITEHVGNVKSDVDTKADKLRDSYHDQLDRLQTDMSSRYNELIEQQMAKFTNVLRAEITSKLPKEKDIEKDMEIRALHAQIDALKEELGKQAKGMEVELELRVQNIIKRLDDMQDTRWKTYTKQIETKLKPAKVSPDAELWALQQDIEKLKIELKNAHTQKAAESDGDQLNIDAKIAVILDKLMVTEKKAIKSELESIEKRLTEKTQETKITDPHLINLEEELEKKMESIVGSITRQMNEQNSKFLSELHDLRKIYEESRSIRTDETKTTQEIHTLKRELELNEAKYLEDVRRLIREYIQKYDADKTGLPDYALESSGGSVVNTRCTVPYKETSRRESIWGIPLWYSSYGPRSVIQRKSQGVNAGECWAFVGEQGYLTVKLSHRIKVTAISYEHLPKELAPQGQLKSAPKEFIIWSYQNADDLSTKVQLGRFVYDINGESLQMFTVEKFVSQGTPVIELETVSNYGAPLTCLYRFRVHGIPIEENSN